MKLSMEKSKIVRITSGAMLTALVIILQLAGSFIKFGQFSISLVLLPIVIGAATLGPIVGGWLGFVFGLTVLISGDAMVFFAINPFGTIVTVLLKGLLAGLCAGLVYVAFAKKNRLIATIAAAVVCPIVNTLVFLLGCFVFFYQTVAEWGTGLGYENTFIYMIVGMVGLNFVFEFLFNLVLAPTALRIIDIVKDQKKD